jgi:hypothetical protein
VNGVYPPPSHEPKKVLKNPKGPLMFLTKKMSTTKTGILYPHEKILDTTLMILNFPMNVGNIKNGKGIK